MLYVDSHMGIFCVHVAMETNLCVTKHDYKDILALKQSMSLISFYFLNQG